jgi:leucyl/phenylalanyl-tRNA--protein transferase
VPRPVEPPPSVWEMPDPERAGEGEVAGVGADLDAGTLLAAYRAGLFPMRVGRRRQLGWWSPVERGVIPIDGLHVSRSLRRSALGFSITYDTAFEPVMRACGDPHRPDGWIDDDFVAAYTRLHELGWAHSAEVWQDERLVGGLYGVAINGLFAGESMFHVVTDASKVAMVATVAKLASVGAVLFDVQWVTPHLASMGAVAVPRAEYLARLELALRVDTVWD